MHLLQHPHHKCTLSTTQCTFCVDNHAASTVQHKQTMPAGNNKHAKQQGSSAGRKIKAKNASPLRPTYASTLEDPSLNSHTKQTVLVAPWTTDNQTPLLPSCYTCTVHGTPQHILLHPKSNYSNPPPRHSVHPRAPLVPVQHTHSCVQHTQRTRGSITCYKPTPTLQQQHKIHTRPPLFCTITLHVYNHALSCQTFSFQTMPINHSFEG